jgi:hypothetical protein
MNGLGVDGVITSWNSDFDGGAIGCQPPFDFFLGRDNHNNITLDH